MNTIAVIGAELQDAVTLAALADGRNTLLLFSKPDQNSDLVKEEILRSHPGATVECFACSRDACWEADEIILLIKPEELRNVAEQFRDVATQKRIGFYAHKGLCTEELIKQFPHSFIVNLDQEKLRDDQLY